ncbi:MAG: hypothetical protein QXF45_00975 [Candidatus Caldarchaeum sp.]
MTKKIDAYTSYLAVNILKTLKNTMDYKTLSHHTGLPVSTLTRYVTNKTLPRGKRTLDLVDKLLKIVNVYHMVQQRLHADSDGLDVSNVVSESYLVELMAAQMLREFAGSRIDCILAYDRAGLILATAFGLSTTKRVYYMSNTETSSTGKWEEIKFRNAGSRVISRIYVPVDVLRSHLLLTVGILDEYVPVKEVLGKISEFKGDFVGIVAVAASKEFLKSVKPYQFGKLVSFAHF